MLDWHGGGTCRRQLDNTPNVLGFGEWVTGKEGRRKSADPVGVCEGEFWVGRPGLLFRSLRLSRDPLCRAKLVNSR